MKSLHDWVRQVAAGDIVVLGSDGLWDNLSDEQVLEEVCASVGAREGASAAAHRLAAAAFRHSLDRHSQTPYSLGASEAFDMVYSGTTLDILTSNGEPSIWYLEGMGESLLGFWGIQWLSIYMTYLFYRWEDG
jgi:hypothetical protein